MAVCCCAGTVPVEACPENHTETTVSTSHPEKRNTESKEALGTEFVFDVYGDIPVAKVVFESDHFLGEGIAKKWDTFVHNYTHEYDMSVGFSDTSVEIVKPAVYKAVNKVNKYYKKAVNKHQVSVIPPSPAWLISWTAPTYLLRTRHPNLRASFALGRPTGSHHRPVR